MKNKDLINELMNYYSLPEIQKDHEAAQKLFCLIADIIAHQI